MSKIFCIIGKSSSGKSTIYNNFINNKKLKFFKILLYTTRPKRNDEINGKEYIFVNKKYFLKLNNKKKIIKYKIYNTINGNWIYFMLDDNTINFNNNNYLMICSLTLYKTIKKHYNNVYPIYIEVEDGERLKRAINREKLQNIPNYVELCRRFLSDTKDFSNSKLKKAGINKRFQNINLKNCIKKIKNYIINVKNIIK